MKTIDRYLRLAFEDKTSRVFHVVNDLLALLIVVSVILIATESVEGLYERYQNLFHISELVIVAVFTLEYFIYIYRARDKRQYLFSFFGLIDLAAILPTYLAFFFAPLLPLHSLLVLRVVRVLRLLRILRVLKLIPYTSQRRGILYAVPWRALEIAFFAMFAAVVISGTLMFLAEGGVAGTKFSNIPQGMWWAVVTLTTVGYGDLVPQTFLGRIVAALTMVAGFILFVVFVAIFSRRLQKALLGDLVEEEDEQNYLR